MKTLFSIAAACLAIAAQAAEPFVTHIKGTVFDRPEDDTVVLFRRRENPRLGVEIPIVNGQFYYDLTTDTPEMWSLSFENENGFKSIYFFAEPGDVVITANSNEQWADNTLQGGALNAEYAAYLNFETELKADFSRAENELIKRGFQEIYWGFELNDATNKYDKITYNENLDTPEGRALFAEYTALEKHRDDLLLDYLRNHPSDVTYALLHTKVKSALVDEEDPAQWLAILAEGKYAQLFPQNPYRKFMTELLDAKEQLVVGGHYIDFTLPDLDGNMVKVSEVVEGKVALIDLWMTWCGPCRGSIMEAIPVWEEFRDRGFVVVTASGDNSLDAIRTAARRDGHPWQTLVDLGGAAGLFARYGLSNSGGSSYLIDRDGTILAINPRETELRKILEEKL